jgi:hypothetical protein
MIKKEFILTILIDEETINEKYPNYKFNWETPAMLVQDIITNAAAVAGTDFSEEDSLELKGLSIEIEPVSNRLLLWKKQ